MTWPNKNPWPYDHPLYGLQRLVDGHIELGHNVLMPDGTVLNKRTCMAIEYENMKHDVVDWEIHAQQEVHHE